MNRVINGNTGSFLSFKTFYIGRGINDKDMQMALKWEEEQQQLACLYILK